MNPRNLQGAVEATMTYRDMSIKAITLDKTREIATKRIKETNQLLETFTEETFGYY